MNKSNDILIYAACYFVQFAFTWIGKLDRTNRLFDTNGHPTPNRAQLIGLQLAGILWLALVPLTELHRPICSILFSNDMQTFPLMLFFACMLATTAYAAFKEGRKIDRSLVPDNLAGFLSFYLPVRIAFLCSYEIFFRGYLLFDCINWFGYIPAILLTSGLTALLHVFYGKREMWVCIPFGILISCCCIAFNSVWPAIAIHIAAYAAYEIPMIYYYLTIKTK